MSNPALPLQSLNAVVTGSSSGIGQAIAMTLASQGANVLVHARSNKQGAESTVQQICVTQSKSSYVLCDLSTLDGCNALLREATHFAPRIDIWVNNAGADILTGSAQSLTFADKLDQLWQTDVLGTIRLSRAVGERMKGNQPAGYVPCIINMGWDQAFSGIEGDAGQLFGTIKSAVMAFTNSLAQALAPQVRVNCVAPGWIKTAWGAETSGYWHERGCNESLMGRWGSPQDVAQAVSFLASPSSEFFTGQIIPVNGGRRCYPISKPTMAPTSPAPQES